MLNDLFGYIRRNTPKMTVGQIKKLLSEINSIKSYLERILKDKGVA